MLQPPVHEKNERNKMTKVLLRSADGLYCIKLDRAAGAAERAQKKAAQLKQLSGLAVHGHPRRRAAPEGAKRASEDQYTTTGPESQARRAIFPPGKVKAGPIPREARPA